MVVLDLLFVLFAAWLTVRVEGAGAPVRLADFYYTYPQHVIPDVDELEKYADQDRYEVHAFEAGIYVPEKNEIGQVEILKRYRFAKEFRGFLFNSTGDLQYVIMRKGRSTRTYTGYMGEMKVSTDGWYYYEKLPEVRKDWIMSRIYKEDTVYAAPVKIAREMFFEKRHCLLRGEAARPELCNKMPNCLGYVVDSDINDCLLSHVARALIRNENATNPDPGQEVIFVVHKHFQKTILVFIEEYRQSVVFFLLCLWDVQVVLFNFDIGGAVIRNVKRKFRYGITKF